MVRKHNLGLGEELHNKAPPALLSQVAAGLLSALGSAQSGTVGPWMDTYRGILLLISVGHRSAHMSRHTCVQTHWDVVGKGIQEEEAHWLKKHSASLIFETAYPPTLTHT